MRTSKLRLSQTQQHVLTALCATDRLWQSSAGPGSLRDGHPPPRSCTVTLCVLIVVVRLPITQTHTFTYIRKSATTTLLGHTVGEKQVIPDSRTTKGLHPNWRSESSDSRARMVSK